MDMSLFCFSRVYRAMLLHLRNLLQPIATNSLTGMELRALLFTSDGGSTATLCHVLDELGLQAEICPELLVAVGRLSTERYDAIIVDWSQETEAAILLKTAREKKALALNVALVADEAAIGRALQQGANSVIKKPVDAAAARDTLSTARDLILSRRSEQREKETRAAAAQAQLQEQEDAIPEMPVVEDAAPKSGYLAQSMSKSALEAEQNMVKPEYESAPSSFQVARGPSAVQEEEAEPAPPPEPVSQKRWDEVRSVFRQSREEPEPEPESDIVPVSAPQTSHDSTGVFSSLSEESVPFEEAAAEPESALASSVPGVRRSRVCGGCGCALRVGARKFLCRQSDVGLPFIYREVQNEYRASYAPNSRTPRGDCGEAFGRNRITNSRRRSTQRSCPGCFQRN